jgi:hypothetical protein
MAQLNKYRGDMYLNDEGHEVVKITYDNSVDPSGTGFVDAFVCKQQMLVHKAVMKVITGVTGSGTISVGTSGSVAALVAATASASLTANTIVAGVSATEAGAVYLAEGSVVGFNIATDTITAGKIEAELVLSKFL